MLILIEFQVNEPSHGPASVTMLRNDPFRPLISVLEHYGLLTERFIFNLSFIFLLFLILLLTGKLDL